MSLLSVLSVSNTISIDRSSSFVSPSPVRGDSVTTSLSDKAIEKQSELSAKAKAVFEESLRQYENGGKGGVSKENPPPLPPKTDRPPLPPKQRSRRSADPDSTSSDDQTYVNSAEIARHSQGSAGGQQRSVSGGRTRLSVNTSLSPVTVSGGQPRGHRDSREADPRPESSEFVYGSYHSGGHAGTKVSVPVRQSESKDVTVNPPNLPPKEMRLAEVSDTKNQIKRKGVSTTRIVGTNSKPPMKSVETQTDENEFYFMYDENGYKLEDEAYSGHTDSEYSPESNRSMSPEFSSNTTSTATYFRPESVTQAVVTPEHYYLGGGGGYSSPASQAMFERPVSASPAGLSRQAGRRKLEPVQSVPVRHHGGPGGPGDPVISGEINWSVSQLRSLFNQGLARDNVRDKTGACVTGESGYVTGVTDNLGYRASPARKQLLERGRQTLGYGDLNYVTMYSPDNNHTDSDQESYV